MVNTAYDNYLDAFYSCEKKPVPTRDVLKIVGKLEEKTQPQFKYGQSIYIVEDLHVSELQVIGVSADRIFVRRLNGVRTSISRNEAVMFTEQGAHDVLERKRKNLLDANNNTVV
jgi:hypothetical protein